MTTPSFQGRSNFAPTLLADGPSGPSTRNKKEKTMNSRGKKILDIEWKREGLEIKVPVKAYERTDYGPNDDKNYRDGKIMKFRAEFKDAGIDVEDTDINKVRKTVMEALDSWYSIKWDLYFMVEISGGRNGQEGNKYKVEFEIEFYVVGKDCRGVDRYMRIPRPKPEEIRNFSQKFTHWSGEAPHDGTLDVGHKKGEYGNREAITRSIVRATPANVAAADQFIVAMEGLLGKMHHHFAPERIEALLQNTALLLPAPKK